MSKVGFVKTVNLYENLMSKLKPKMLTQEKFEVEVYDYIIVPGVLSQEDAAEMREALARLDRECAIDHFYLGKARLVANLPTYGPVFLRPLTIPRFCP